MFVYVEGTQYIIYIISTLTTGMTFLKIMDVCLVSVVRDRSLRRADHCSRGVLPKVLRRCV